jgi:nucleoside-diphosphate-sugar epimerase
MKDRKILIAGGTGFIGRRLVNCLSNAGNICYIITRHTKTDTYNTYYIKADLSLCDDKFFSGLEKKHGPFDAAVYMAANIPTISQKKEDYPDALMSTLFPSVKFFQFVSTYVKKIVFISSIDVVGIPKSYLYTEDTPLAPITPYAVSKLTCELYLKSIVANYGQNAIVLRFSQVYGPDEPVVRIIPILLDALRNDKIFNLYGTGEERRRFLYIDDAVSAIILALKSEQKGVFNIAGKSTNSIIDLIEDAESVFEKKLILKRINYQGKIFDNVPDITKAGELLCYYPQYSLEEGLRKIYADAK